MMPPHLGAPDRGFTLLEVLVVAVVFGFILLEIGQGLDFGVQASAAQRTIVGRQADLDSVDRLLRGLIVRMDPGSRNAAPHPVGTPKSFAFTTDLPPGAANPFARHVDASLSLERGRLLLRWAAHLHSGVPVSVTPAADVLLTGVTRVEFSYLAPDVASGGSWREQWTEPYLPRLVRIHIGFAKTDPRHWPDIVAEPRQDRPDG